MTNKEAALAAFWQRVERHEQEENTVDNASLPAGSPLYFRCEACFTQIIVAEDFLTKPRLCYDCRDLADRGWIFEMQPPHTGWNAGR